jgi:tetratricopeptide (TPR) repeat protein
LTRDVETDSEYRGRALARLGAIERAAGRNPAAAAAFEELVSLDPQRANEEGAFHALAEIEIDEDDAEGALRTLDRYESSFEADSRALEIRVKAAAAANKIDRAARALERLSRGFPESGDAIALARIELADARQRSGKLDEALADYELARGETNDGNLRARAAYGEALVHARAQRWADAKLRFEATVELAPESAWAAEAWFKLGQFHSREGDHKAAQRAYAALSEGFPGHRSAVESLRGEASAWRQLQRFDEALERYHRILENYPEFEGAEDVLSNIAYCHHEMGQFEVAIVAYRRVMPLLDEEAQAYAQFWIADSLDKLGRYEDAATEFLRIPYLYPTQGQLPVTAQLKAGEAYEKSGKAAAAQQLYERVLAAHGPSSQWGAEAQRRLDRLTEGERGSR